VPSFEGHPRSQLVSSTDMSKSTKTYVNSHRAEGSWLKEMQNQTNCSPLLRQWDPSLQLANHLGGTRTRESEKVEVKHLSTQKLVSVLLELIGLAKTRFLFCKRMCVLMCNYRHFSFSFRCDMRRY
jgi:hypothetical protein